MDLNKLLSQMTLEEKAGQLSQIFDGDYYNAQDIDVTVVGSISGIKDSVGIKAIQEDYLERSRLKIPLYFILDIVHGYKINYPIALAAGCSFNPELLGKAVAVSAREGLAAGINVTYSPMADMTFDPRWGRTIENTGEDHYLNSLYTRETIRNFEDNNMASCMKHFIGYGTCEGGKDYATASFSDMTMYNVMLPQFRAAIEENVKFVMAGFSAVDGVPPTANKYLLKDVLRGQLGFDGIIISDHSSIPELVNHGIAKDEKHAALLAFEAGVEVELATTTYLRYLPELVREGKIEEADLDKSVMRVLKLKEELNLFENPYQMDVERDTNNLFFEESKKVAFEMACESIVLAKNEATLPLSDEEYIIMGPHVDETYILGFNAANAIYEETVTVRQGLENYGVNIVDGPKINYKNNSVVDLPKNKKVIITIGEFYRDSGESISRSNIQIDESQVKILNELKVNGCEVNAILFNGRALDLSNVIESIDSLLIAFLPGSEGGNAIGAIMSGQVNPSAKLSTTFPRSVGQIPIYYNSLPSGRLKTFEEQEWVSGYDDLSTTPLFAFGHGLSYSNFTYSNVVCENGKVSLTITNNSEITGMDNVQLYYWDKVAQISRPMKQLFNFTKVLVEANSSVEVEMSYTKEDFKYYLKNGDEVIESGDVVIYVASASDKVITEFTVEV